MILIYSAKPIHLGAYNGGTTSDVYGSNGKLGTLDAAATIEISWEFTTMGVWTVLVLMSAYGLWHLTVSLRHLKIRPRVFLEPIRGDFAWTLPPADADFTEKLPRF